MCEKFIISNFPKLAVNVLYEMNLVVNHRHQSTSNWTSNQGFEKIFEEIIP